MNKNGRNALRVLRTADIESHGIRCMKAVSGSYTVAIGKSLAPSRALIADRYWRKGYSPNHILTSHGAVIDAAAGMGMWLVPLLVTLDSLGGSAGRSLFRQTRLDTGRGHKLAELSRFAILPGQTTRSVMAAMFHFVYYYTYLLNGVTDLVCEVIPRHAAAQKRILGFQQIAGPRRCNRVGGEAAVLLHRETLEWL